MTARCLSCGLAIKHHFKSSASGTRGRKLSCFDALLAHRRASVKRMSFVALLRKVVGR